MPLLVDVSDAVLSATAAFVSACIAPGEQLKHTYRCMVMPIPRRSLTRSTLLITSLPKLSNTNTFHIGSPSVLRIGVVLGMSPFDAEGSWCRSSLACTS